MQHPTLSIVAGGFGSRDARQQGHRRRDDRKRGEHPRSHQRVVLEAWGLERLPEPSVEEEAQEAEGTSSLGEPAGDADGEAAAGSRQTGEEDDIRELLIAIDVS